MTNISRTVEVESNLTEGVSNEETEMNRILQATESPLSAYARFLARIERSDPLMGRWKADKIKVWKPITEYVKADILYSRKTLSHRVVSLNGSTGTGKSFAAMKLASWLDHNGWWKYNSKKDEYELPKIFWSVPDMLRYVRSPECKEGECLVLDEEVHRGGTGSKGIEEALHNLEMTTRFYQLNFIFVYVIQRSHKCHYSLYTSRVHYNPPPLADYVVLGVLQPVSFSLSEKEGGFQLLGLMTIDVPPQGVIDAYHKKKREFVETMVKSGGFGEEIDIMETYGDFLEELEKDKVYTRLKNITDRAEYISLKTGLGKGVSNLLVKVSKIRDEMGEDY